MCTDSTTGDNVTSIADQTASLDMSCGNLCTAQPRTLLLPLLLGHGTVLLLMSLMGYDQSRLQSLISVSFAAFCGIMLLSFLYVRKALGSKAILIIAAAYFVKVFVGVFHSLHFFDSDYFTDAMGFNYFADYMWMEGKMRDAADHWRQYGLSPLPITFYAQNKNPLLLAYNGFLYYLSGENYVNIAPWNALHSIYVAVIIGALALHAGASKMQARFALGLAAFQPFGFISNIMWRDSVGQFWMLLGLYLFIVTKDKKYLWIITLPLACLFALSQREPYLLAVLGLAAYLSLEAIFREKQKMTKKLVILLAVVAVSCFLPELTSFAFERYTRGDQLNISPVLFPLRILRALAGPFPWYQLFMGVNGAEFMPPDFIQAVYNLTLIILAVPLALKMWKESKRIEPSMLVAFLLYFMAVQAKGIHIAYTSIGVVLLLPMICQLPRTTWFRTFVLCFYGFLFANIAYGMSGLAGGGIIMSLTGY